MDFFIVSKGLAQAPATKAAVQAAEVRPHLVASLDFDELLDQIQVCRCRVARRHGADIPPSVYKKPPEPTQGWSDFRTVSAEALSEMEVGEVQPPRKT